MKLLAAKVTNFGSYDNLELNFDDLGLALIYGPTGSGKSTLQDIPSWILFGVTAKGGNADDVRSWTAPNSPTSGELELQIRNSRIAIVRIRGKQGQNDLYWLEEGSQTANRGKDITETQQLLNKRLGIDPYLYTIGAYYNEFSPSGAFFTAKASDRRLMFEALADLSLPTRLTERIADAKKETRKAFTEVLERFNKTDGKLEQLRRHEIAVKRDAESWRKNQERSIEELKVRNTNFHKEKESKIQALEFKKERFEMNRKASIHKFEKDLQKKLETFVSQKSCPNCGELRTSDENELVEINDQYTYLIEKEQTSENPYFSEQENVRTQENPYETRIQAEEVKINPFLSQLHIINCDILDIESNKKALSIQLDNLNHRNDSLAQLHKLGDMLRQTFLTNTVKTIEFEVNRYLETYFDSELRVLLQMDSGDKLDILLWKSGHECSYRQLSKGQGSLLKLCFSISTMKAASNKSGISFDTLMLDEALDGLDTDLKLKAFNLFSELAKDHNTVLVIDHNEGLQNLFDKKFYVTINSDISSISEV